MSQTTKDTTQRVHELHATGAHTGYKRTRRHPSVLPFLYGSQSKVDIINLEQSIVQLDSALEFIKKLARERKQVLFIGTKAEAKHTIKAKAGSISQPYAEERWVGGTLTNTKEIDVRIKKLEMLLEKEEKGDLVYKTKKEKLLIVREIGRLSRMFSGLLTLRGMPGAMCVIDPRKEHIAVKEAAVKGIPVIALANTDCDISSIAYPVVANDSSSRTISWFLDQIAQAYQAGVAEIPVVQPVADVKKENVVKK